MNVNSTKKLIANGLAEPDDVPILEAIEQNFATSITSEMVKLIKSGSQGVAKQFIPDAKELNILPTELADPIGDQQFSPVKGLIHRFVDRVLLKVVNVCPVYCRFCFRKEMLGPKADKVLSDAALAACYAYIQEHPQISEAILSGGDPLILNPQKVGNILGKLDHITNLKILRIHTRIPIVDPTRISQAMLQVLTTNNILYLVIHINHPDELTTDAIAAVNKLRRTGIILLSQTVLLKGINDSAMVLGDLFKRLVEIGIKPYYLHQLDKAKGTSHFAVAVERGLAIMEKLREQVTGLALPSYVIDTAAVTGKLLVSSLS